MELPIARPPWTKVGKKIESAVRKALYDFEMLDGIEKLAIALSGGKDSLTLLYMLKAILGRGFPDINLCAIHVSGEFSCGAGIHVDYLRNICRELDVEYIVQESQQKLEYLECYPCSRERRRLLFEGAKKLGANTVAFGHHRDDNAQTMLMNLLHKGEFAGTLPKLHMQNFGITIIRPLIFINENNIKQFAEIHHFRRIVCQCPVGQNSMRKKVDTLLNEMEELFPNARANVARATLLYGSNKAAFTTRRN